MPFSLQAQGRDPTTPGHVNSAAQAGNVAPETAWDLSEILIRDTSRRAIINGATFKAGDYLNDTTRLIKIAAGHVVIQQDGMPQKLYLVPSVKKPLK